MSTAEPGLNSLYDRAFYDSLDGDVRASADTVAPVVIDLVHPASMLDIGCGRGTWLAAFSRLGITDVVGVDGPHIAATDLEIPTESFVARDLREPLDLGRRFDLAMSLEVAEHLDAAYAEAFVASLVAHAPVVLFSAAVPKQGGVEHVNEQWPSYWAARFAAHDYVPVDAVRPAVWSNGSVAYWYAQNTLLYADATDPATAGLRAAAPAAIPLDLVHPGMFLRPPAKAHPAPPSLSRTLRNVPGATVRAVRHRLDRRPQESGS